MLEMKVLEMLWKTRERAGDHYGAMTLSDVVEQRGPWCDARPGPAGDGGEAVGRSTRPVAPASASASASASAITSSASGLSGLGMMGI